MKNKKAEKKLNGEEKGYLSGLLEAHRSKINFLSEKEQKNKQIQEDLKTAKSIERKLSLSNNRENRY